MDHTSHSTPLNTNLSTTTSPQITSTRLPVSPIVSAGIFGMIVVSTGAMGSNLHKVENDEMSMSDAVKDSLVKGAAGGVVAAGGTAAATALTSGGFLGLGVSLAAATGISYLLSK